MNKKLIALLCISPLILSACNLDGIFDFINNNIPDFEPNGGNTDDDEDEDIEFEITSALFTDEAGHLKVNYTSNYVSPFKIGKHPFKKLNVSGVAASEIDSSHDDYFTILSPVVNEILKFEFFDTSDRLYISTKYENIIMYDEGSQGQTIEFPTGYSNLYWSDEFNGDALDTSKWTYDIGNGYSGWGNNESQYYTNYNDIVGGGQLTIRAKKERVSNFDYTSTRIKTQNKVKFTYGYIEARIALPAVTGMWPAFWMMPNDSRYGGWPHSGEIDIMEAKGRLQYRSSSAIHFSTSSGSHTYLTDERSGHDIAEFHKYAVEWQPDYIKFYIDDYNYFSTYKNQWGTVNAQDSETAPFDKDFYIILNLAIGGHFDNYQLPPDSFVSADMKVDYVRVFK